MIGKSRVWSTSVRVAAIGVVIAAAYYGLSGIRGLFPKASGPRAIDATFTSQETASSAPLELFDSILAGGFWALPGGYWTISQASISDDALESFWTDLTHVAADLQQLDTTGHFDSLVPMLIQAGRATERVGDVQLYRIKLRQGHLGVVIRHQGGRDVVVGGALLIPAADERWQAYRLHVNPLGSADGTTLKPTLTENAAAQLLAVRFDDQGRRIAEFVRLPPAYSDGPAAITTLEEAEQTPTIQPSRIKHRTSPLGQFYEWQVSQPGGTLQLVVNATLINDADRNRND